jgi:hypothetical protein
VTITKTPATSRSQASKKDVIWGVTSLDDALQTAVKRFGSPARKREL